MADRTVLFLDYQNVYMGAREQFHPSGGATQGGQINPIRLGEEIVARDKFPRTLTQVRIYRGMPAVHDTRSHQACARQTAQWIRDPRVHVTSRPLLYSRDRSTGRQIGREKGIDVALALDFATMAVRDQYDVGVMFSTDTDLEPALEFVADLTRGNQGPRAEVANWTGNDGKHKPRLSPPNHKLFCHWLGEDVYQRCADPTKYTKP